MTTHTTRPVRRRTSRSRKVEVPTAPPAPPAVARGNPLTHSVHFLDDHGTPWLVYLESGPASPSLWPNAAVIPGRRLRFDSHEASLIASSFPAGAPFLTHERLQAVFEAAVPVEASGPSTPAVQVAEPGSVSASDIAFPFDSWTDKLLRFAAPALGLALALRDLVLPRRS